MAIYQVRHATTYTYREPVTICHNLAHLMPRQSPGHYWRRHEMDIFPSPSMRSERTDIFGNTLTFFAIQEPHRKLEVIAHGVVEVTNGHDDGVALQWPWEQVRDALQSEPPGTRLSARQFLFPSPHVDWDQQVIDYTRVSFQPGRPILDALMDLTARINRDFTYDCKATTIGTTVSELMAQRKGVCQDLAHVQAACLRSMGLAARYVSGYLLSAAPPGRPRLLGIDASHAWVSAYVPDNQWVDLDPTNNLRPSDQHVTIAWGRDYSDVCPLRGVILGGGTQTVKVAVDVVPEISGGDLN